MATLCFDSTAGNAYILCTTALTAADCGAEATCCIDFTVSYNNLCGRAVLTAADCGTVVALCRNIAAFDCNLSGVAVLTTTDSGFVTCGNIKCTAVDNDIAADICRRVSVVFINAANVLTGQATLTAKCDCCGKSRSENLINIVFARKSEIDIAALCNREFTKCRNIIESNACDTRAKSDAALKRICEGRIFIR